MKRKLALFLSVLMLATLLLPVGAFAQETQKGLEEALKNVKAKFDIPEDFKFDYNVHTENGASVWYLNWSSQDGKEGNISVRIDDAGRILGFDSWKPYESAQNKFPKYSRQEARNIADAFIKKANPAIASRFKYQESSQGSISGNTHYFNYYRVENGIPFYSNYIAVNVNRETGEVNSFHMNWSDGLTFPEAGDAMSALEAQKSYEDNIGLKIVYRYLQENDQIKLYAVYTPAFAGNSYAIDAVTGERVRLGGGYEVYSKDAEVNFAEAQARGDGGLPSLTPEELKAIENISGLLTREQAEKIVRDSEHLALDTGLKLTSSSLSRNWPLRNEFDWYLNFTGEQDGKYRHAEVTVNAQSGEIKSFYIGTAFKESDTAKYDRDESKAEVEKFFKEFKPELFKEVEFEENEYESAIYDEGTKPTLYNFTYVRKVNGAYFPDNSVRIGYDAVNGRVVNFNLSWFDTSFPALDKAVPVETVYANLFGDIGLELQYRPKYVQQAGRVQPDGAATQEITLVYSLKPGKPNYFDVNTGILTDSEGKPYKEAGAVEYTDLSGHYAEKQIAALAEYGIYLDGSEFKPDEAIVQKDYLYLVSKIMADYYWLPLTEGGSDREIDNLYSELLRQGVIKEGEKNPNGAVTREDAVKFLIRALKYSEVADIKGIYKLDFEDESEINPDLIGYVAIASGLRIIGGGEGSFLPKDSLTRAEAAVMIYNYLQR